MSIKMGKLNYKELALYIYYKSFAGEDGYCNKTIRHIAEELEMSTVTVIKTRDSLIEKGFIELHKINDRTHMIFINDIWAENEVVLKEYQHVSRLKHHVLKSDI